MPERFRHPPPVTIIRPLCGVDAFTEATLASSFALQCPSYELLFCVAREDDPVVPIARRLIEQHPSISAKLLIGNDAASSNPKLNNCVKGWSAAANNWIVLSDANVQLPPD